MKKLASNLTIAKILSEADQKWHNKNFWYEKKNDVYQPKTFGETISDIWALAAAFTKMGFSDKKIMLYAPNSYEWLIADLALMGYTGINVPVNKDWQLNELSEAINFIEPSAIIYSKNYNYEIIKAIKKSQPKIKCLSMENDLPKLLEIGKKLLSQKKVKLQGKKTNGICKIMFTSGTTGKPKAVMLTQKNMLVGWENLNRRVTLTESDVGYLFLPMYHTYGEIYNVLYAFLGGWSMYLCSDTKKIMAEIVQVRPNVICVVPLIFERIYRSINLPTKIVLHILIAISNFLRLFNLDLRKIFFKKFHLLLGGKIKYIFCAGATYDYKLKKFFNNLGLPILEAYALTETAASLTIEYPRPWRNQSVGEVFENIKVKIINGEVCVKGDNVFAGYYKNEQAIQAVCDRDGYFHTGDLGYLDEENRLYFTGRKKKIRVLSNGKNIYPI